MSGTEQHLRNLRLSLRHEVFDGVVAITEQQVVKHAKQTDNTELSRLAQRLEKRLAEANATRHEIYDESVRAEIRLLGIKRPSDEYVARFVDQILAKVQKYDDRRESWVYVLPDGTLGADKWRYNSCGPQKPTRQAIPDHALFYLFVTNTKSREDTIRDILDEITRYWG